MMKACTDAGLFSWHHRPRLGSYQQGLYLRQQDAGLDRFLQGAMSAHQETHLQEMPERAMASDSHGDNFRGMMARP